jgi:HAE1 family hydrophobic/amphiphilic exporter-1
VIIATSIPVSLMGAIAVMYFFGYTFNSVTLLALLLLVGVVVDDAIVVLENIYRHREEDRNTSAMAAATTGSREVTFAVIAASFSLVAIFAPVVFVSGILGQFLRSFAVVVTFGVLVSLFVSLTLTPMLCSRYLEVQAKHGRMYWALEHMFERIDNFYRRMLRWSLRNRIIVLLAALLSFLAAIPIFGTLPRELAPQADEGRFLVGIRTPLGSSIEYTEDKAARGGSRGQELSGDHYRVRHHRPRLGAAGQSGDAGGAHEAARRAQPLAGRSDQFVPPGPVANRGRARFPARLRLVQGQRSEPLQFVVKGPNLQEMGRLAGELQRALQADPEIGRMDTDLQLDLPQLVLEPDRVRAAGLEPQLHRRGARGQHADRRHRHRQVQRLSRRRRALRRARQGQGRRIPAAGRPVEDLPAQPPGASWYASTRWRASAKRSARR